MIDFIELEIPGAYLVKNFSSKDDRGTFVKTFNQEKLKEIGFTGSFTESYYSISKKNVIRGMHFQKPPFQHEKLVYVTSGKILDVIIDLRKDYSTYGNYLTLKLNEFGDAIFIPKGCAHGFLALSEIVTVVYNVSSVYEPSADDGILWNSFGFNWEVNSPLLSERDKGFTTFENFRSPF